MMRNLSLNGEWQLQVAGTEEWMRTNVPGSVVCTLVEAGRIEDPYYRDNVEIAKEWMRKDYEYRKIFTVSQSVLNEECVLLRCYGLDTLAGITINGAKIADTDNMHRTYEFDVKEYLREGDNEIRIYFSTALNFIEEQQAKYPITIGNMASTMKGIGHIRKAHNMFGWDSEPPVPDAGIWRDIELTAFSKARLDTIHIRQKHNEGEVVLTIAVPVEKVSRCDLSADVEVVTPDGVIIKAKAKEEEGTLKAELTVTDPQLWWPNGYGEQPLYMVRTVLYVDGEAADESEKYIGLRTIWLDRSRDRHGRAMQFIVNGVPIFAKGADYYPLDKFLIRETEVKKEELIQSCKEANYNMIRIWGGGIYPSDSLYDYADQYGILLWTDLMFACTGYHYTEEFEKNIIQEVADNVKRLRHHASLALWVGNNEIEWLLDLSDYSGGVEKGGPENLRNYIRQFEVVLADVCREYDPDTSYLSSTPTSDGAVYYPNDGVNGDIHNWEIWHNNALPYEHYKDYPARFASEFGLQSFPVYKTMKEVLAKEDESITSRIMDYKQRDASGCGNAKIMLYILRDLPAPANFEKTLYASQVVQAEAVRYGSEFNRRSMGYCAGNLFWQLGDCWQAPTWSCIDYEGRWKALQYQCKKFYAPTLLSLDRDGDSLDFYVVNDRLMNIDGEIVWKLCDSVSGIICKGQKEVVAEKQSSTKMLTLNVSDLLKNTDATEVYLTADLLAGGQSVSTSYFLFDKPKHFNFAPANIRAEVSETDNEIVVTLHSDAFAMYVYVDFESADFHFDDNFFNMEKGERVIHAKKQENSFSAEELQKQIKIMTVAGIGEC